MGGGHVDRISAFVDATLQAAVQSPAEERALERRIVRDAGIAFEPEARIDAADLPARPASDDRIAALLWSSHGALPPKVSEAVVVQTLCAAGTDRAADLLGIRPAQLTLLIGRAARRSRALRLGVGSIGPTELRLGLKAADARLRGLLRRAARQGPLGGPIEAMLTDWLELVGSYRGRKKKRAGDT